jgi:hypothetical protein
LDASGRLRRIVGEEQADVTARLRFAKTAGQVGLCLHARPRPGSVAGQWSGVRAVVDFERGLLSLAEGSDGDELAVAVPDRVRKALGKRREHELVFALQGERVTAHLNGARLLDERVDKALTMGRGQIGVLEVGDAERDSAVLGVDVLGQAGH